MKVLFAVSNEEMSENIVKKYQREYKEIISYKNVYYFNAILKELQKDKTYERIVISEDLEAFTNNQYDQIDKFIFEKLDNISDEASNYQGDNIPIIFICSDRRTKSEQMLVKLFGISIYDALLGQDRNLDEVCKLINKPRSKKEAKAYYKIDVDNVKYVPESENDVSEVEIQNILDHYKRLGKNEEKYIESFDNIASQYNDIQLKIICKFLPLNVRAVLEEKSAKYQKLFAYGDKVADKLRKPKNDAKLSGTSEKLLKTVNTPENILAKPVVIPSAVNLQTTKKLSKPKVVTQTEEDKIEQIEKEISKYVNNEVIDNKADEEKTSVNVTSKVEEPIETVEEEIVKPAPRKRGRPRKNPLPEPTENITPKRRGRPKKKVNDENQIKIINDENDVIMPGANMEKEEDNNVVMPGINMQDEEDNDVMMPGINMQDEEENDVMMPGINMQDEEDNDVMMPGINMQDEQDNDVMMPGINMQNEKNDIMMPRANMNETNFNRVADNQNQFINSERNYNKEEKIVDISSLLTQDKKVACFVGTSKNGTSFVVNNVAQVLSSQGISTAILDTTKNRNAYYIYTNNEEELRNTAMTCFENLTNGVAKGIQVNRNLTVYTSLPDDEYLDNTEEILQTLIKNYSVVLIDCDFQTPISYFANSQEIYLIQSMDILTIQPLTAFLNVLRSRNVLDEKKLRIILNKAEKLRKVNDKIIIGGMSSYNDPAMTYMVDLFDKNLIKYISIPFDEQVYVKYLEGIIDCEISLKGYSKNIIQILTELANMIYPVKNGKTTYRPPTVNSNGFTPSINSTLEQMRKY